MIFLEQKLDAIRAELHQIIRVGKVVALLPAKGAVRVEFLDADTGGKGMVSYELPLLTAKTLADKSYWMPDLDEQVVCLFLPFSLQEGFVLGSLYSSVDKAPLADKDVKHISFSDGSSFSYHRKEHLLSGRVCGGNAILEVDGDARVTAGGNIAAQAEGDVEIQAGGKASVTAGSKVVVSAPDIVLSGNISASGAGGGAGAETKHADTEHTGGYHLHGNLVVDGNITAAGSILAGGENSNHHTH